MDDNSTDNSPVNPVNNPPPPNLINRERVIQPLSDNLQAPTPATPPPPVQPVAATVQPMASPVYPEPANSFPSAQIPPLNTNSIGLTGYQMQQQKKGVNTKSRLLS